MRTTYDTVRCTQDQWYTSGVMEHLAQHHFAQHPDCQFAEVYEHGGWFLGYRRDLTIFSTANDRAILSVPQPQPTAHSGNTYQYPEIK